MTATAHALIGGVIASSFHNPAIGLPLAALSHPIADMIPHWDFGLGWRNKTKTKLFIEGTADLGIGIILTFWIFGGTTDTAYLLAAIFLSESWDLFQAPYWLLDWKFPPFSWFYKFQHEINAKAKLPWGIVTQAATVIVLAIVLR